MSADQVFALCCLFEADRVAAGGLRREVSSACLSAFVHVGVVRGYSERRRREMFLITRQTCA